MKHLFILTSLLLSFTLGACDLSSPFGDIGNTKLGGDGDYSFEDQNLQGNIGANSFEFVSGYAGVNQLDETQYLVNLYSVEPESGLEPWEAGAYPTGAPAVAFVVPQAVGLYELVIDPNDLDGSQTVTLVEDQDGSTANYVCHLGAIDITSIDTAAGTIEGRVDARDLSDNDVNGTFDVPIAPENPPEQ